jgi:hypothetical protein
MSAHTIAKKNNILAHMVADAFIAKVFRPLIRKKSKRVQEKENDELIID